MAAMWKRFSWHGRREGVNSVSTNLESKRVGRYSLHLRSGLVAPEAVPLNQLQPSNLAIPCSRSSPNLLSSHKYLMNCTRPAEQPVYASRGRHRPGADATEGPREKTPDFFAPGHDIGEPTHVREENSHDLGNNSHGLGEPRHGEVVRGHGVTSVLHEMDETPDDRRPTQGRTVGIHPPKGVDETRGPPGPVLLTKFDSRATAQWATLNF